MKPRMMVIPLFMSGVLSAMPSIAQDSLRAFHPDSFGEVIAQANARPLVVLIWSLDCSYCLSSFQSLAQAKAVRGIDVVTVATDPYDDAATRQSITQKLQAGGLTGRAWAFGPWPSAKLRYAIDPKWRGELPRSYWYRNGRLIAVHSGAVTSEMAMKHVVD